MSRYRKIVSKLVASLFLIAAFSFNNSALAADGEALFKSNCASCHKVDKDFTGPALKDWKSKVPEGDWIYHWIASPTKMIATDAYAKDLFKKWGPTTMTAFPALTKEEIDAILKYVDDYKGEPVATPGAPGVTAEDHSTLWYGILTLIFALIGFVLLQVNSNLRKLSDEKEGVQRGEPVPFYRNKTYLMTGILVLFALGGYWTINGAIGMGRHKNYEPVQPIFYSHKVHAGVNQISCLYCHGSAQDSKTAGIPSVNVCMNCHKAIKEYTGEKIFRQDGTEVNGTEEIQK